MTAANVCDIMRARCATSSKHAACVAVRRQAKGEISWREYVQGVNEPYAFYNHRLKLTVLSYCDDITPYATRRFVCKNKTVFAASHKTKLVFADYAK